MAAACRLARRSLLLAAATVTAAASPADPPCAGIILHGLGADGSDLRDLGSMLWPQAQGRWLAPDAPVRAVTINGGMRMRAWHDVRSMNLLVDEDRAGIEDSARIIGGLIDDLQDDGIPAGNIALVGFSQGGAMALHAGLRRDPPLGAIVGMSCYLPLADALAAEAPAATKQVPVFLGAGTLDGVVPAAQTEAAAEQLRARGNEVEFRSYPIAHGIAPEELADIAAFLGARISCS